MHRHNLSRHLLQTAITATLLFLAADTLAAEEHRLVLDPETTEIQFTLDATGHTVEGELFLRSGEVQFDLGSGIASGTLTIDARRTATHNDKRDRKMHDTVLESERHPLILFEASSIRGHLPAEAGSGQGKVALGGKIVLLGKDHRVTLTLEVMRSGSVLTATGSFPVPYVAWGLHDPSVFVLRVAKEVDVSLTARGRLMLVEPEPAPEPAPEPKATRDPSSDSDSD